MSEYKIGGVRLNSRALLAPMAGIMIESYLKGKLSAASETRAKRIENKIISK